MDRKDNDMFDLGNPVPLEYDVAFDTWSLRCANALLTGLISGQSRGGIRVFSFSVRPEDDVIEVIVDYYMNSPELQERVGYRFVISALHSLSPDNPVSAAGLYVDDLFLLPVNLPGDPTDGIRWITRPGFS
ncbi:hypothetical protein [Rhodococcus artemisiae]|uniref:Immunity protein 50 of polymorphic toxin system n=1 Tax=Rhodococcus artemisiae TaxID=714159 RepID=A0ABU7LKV6_9NOCA|nr:hypothetical protein [Rhodococcus artemisiae]MEE2062207.1 hypothetical protein [Rhodococcus artemisiae]